MQLILREQAQCGNQLLAQCLLRIGAHDRECRLGLVRRVVPGLRYSNMARHLVGASMRQQQTCQGLQRMQFRRVRPQGAMRALWTWV